MTETLRDIEITPVDLAKSIEAGDVVQLLDVRAPERLASGRVDTGPPERFYNIRGSEMLAIHDPAAAGLDRGLPVVAICAHGNSSVPVARHLIERGFSALSLSGGMVGWNNVLVARKVAPPQGYDGLVQFDRIAKGSLGYLLISGDSAFVIDAPLDFAPFERAVADAGAKIVGVADTHVHADYLSGGPAFAAKCSAPYYLHPADNAYPYDGTPGKLAISPLSDGQEIAVGNGKISVRHTPGHTEGSVCLLAGDAAFTGDFLFIGSIGRPDLAGKTREWSADLFASIVRAKTEWPDAMCIFPAHYGSAAEKNADRSVWRTLGELKAANPHLGIADSEAFLSWVEARISTPPEQYRRIKGVNVGLFRVSALEIEELECGKNQCALE